MPVRCDSSLDGIDWARVKDDLTADDFDNASLGFCPQPEFWSAVSGTWLDNDANR